MYALNDTSAKSMLAIHVECNLLDVVYRNLYTGTCACVQERIHICVLSFGLQLRGPTMTDKVGVSNSITEKVYVACRHSLCTDVYFINCRRFMVKSKLLGMFVDITLVA